jgi:CheY-like chemotaxis protein/HPt (histidine-containing phosphotransfer) domain-containing protein
VATPEPNRLPESILLIDDDVISREVLATLLEMQGFRVESAEHGAQALDLLQRSTAQPEVILMDAQMPGLSGAELIQALRSACNPAGNPRIVAISGSEVGEEIHRTADGFLLKPIQVEDLIALLESSKAAKEATPKINAAGSEGIESERTNPEVINPVVLGKLKAMMPPSAVLEIYTAVASDLETRLVTLSTAMDAGDIAEVKRIAHTIKGGCAMVGLSPAIESAARLESSNTSETWPNDFLQLHFALSMLRSILGDGLL